MSPLVAIDREASTVQFGGRRFPGVALICPRSPKRDDESDLDRTLAAGGGDQSVYVPAENGLLFRVEESENEHHHGLSLDLHARTCELVYQIDEATWLPWGVGVYNGDLVVGHSNLWYWADPDWVVETIDRLSHKPFTQPDGPLCQLVRLDHFDRLSAAS